MNNTMKNLLSIMTLKESASETLDHILGRFKYEVKQFESGEELDSNLYDALYDYYSLNGEMPYGTAKARTGDPMEWVADKLYRELHSQGPRMPSLGEDSVDPTPDDDDAVLVEKGNDIPSVAEVSNEAISDVLLGLGLDEGYDFFFEDGLVAIGRSTAKVIINALKNDLTITADPYISSVDGEEVRIGFGRKTARSSLPKDDVNNLMKVPDLEENANGVKKTAWSELVDDHLSNNADDWYDENGQVDPDGAYDAGGHYFADRDADKNDYNRDIMQEDNDDLCPVCSGSGEGQYDGTVCQSCHGSGVEGASTNDDDYDEDKEDDRRFYESTDEWYNAKGQVDPNGAYDAGGHYYAERDADKNEYNLDEDFGVTAGIAGGLAAGSYLGGKIGNRISAYKNRAAAETAGKAPKSTGVLNRIKNSKGYGELDFAESRSARRATPINESVSVSITATDEDALDILRKLSGMGTQESCATFAVTPGQTSPFTSVNSDDFSSVYEAKLPNVPKVNDDKTDYANGPKEKYATLDSLLDAGDDLNRPKKQHPNAAAKGDNPMESKMWGKFNRFVNEAKKLSAKEKVDADKKDKEFWAKEQKADASRAALRNNSGKKSITKEGKIDDFRDAQEAKRQADADKFKFGKDKKPAAATRQVKGSKYGGSKQKDDEELTEGYDIDCFTQGNRHNDSSAQPEFENKVTYDAIDDQAFPVSIYTLRGKPVAWYDSENHCGYRLRAKAGSVNEVSDETVRSLITKRQANNRTAQDSASVAGQTAASFARTGAAADAARDKVSNTYNAAGKRLDRNSRLQEVEDATDDSYAEYLLTIFKEAIHGDRVHCNGLLDELGSLYDEKSYMTKQERRSYALAMKAAEYADVNDHVTAMKYLNSAIELVSSAPVTEGKAEDAKDKKLVKTADQKDAAKAPAAKEKVARNDKDDGDHVRRVKGTRY